MNNQDERYDAVVVGARCAGASLAIRLARAGWRVALVDRDRFPSDTISTHVMFPDSLQLLEQLGAMDRLRAGHRLAPVGYSWRVLGQEVAGTFTPVGGYDRGLAVRRITLDGVLVELAAEAGANVHLGTRARGILGAGTTDDPARGVVLDDGRRLLAPWIVAADGRRSMVARRLGLRPYGTQRGDVSLLFGYWTGLPSTEWCRLDMHERSALMSVPCEDRPHLLTVAGPAELTRGTPAELERRYRDALHRFPAVLNPRLLAGAELVSAVVAAPETMMRGLGRAAAGPGWALVGDAGRRIRPPRRASATLFTRADMSRKTSSAGAIWRATRPGATPGSPAMPTGPSRPVASRGEAVGLYAGLAAEREAGQEFLDTFTKRTRPAEVFTPERTRRWRLAAGYEDGLHRLTGLAERLDEAQLDAIGRDRLFRVISGRRDATTIKSLDWDGDPAPYLAVISPYPLPS